jgi:hypothetical protein
MTHLSRLNHLLLHQKLIIQALLDLFCMRLRFLHFLTFRLHPQLVFLFRPLLLHLQLLLGTLGRGLGCSELTLEPF